MSGIKRKISTEEKQSDASENEAETQILAKKNKNSEVENFNLLFSCVLEFIIKDLGIGNKDIEQAAQKIKKSFKPEATIKYMSIAFDSPKNACAYFYCYSSLNVAIARNRFLYAFNNCQELMKCVESPNINVISLGGGPGIDMIGFCSAMQECIEENRNKQFDLTIVDRYKSWGYFYNIIEYFIRNEKFGNTFHQNYFVNSSYLTVDLRDKSPPWKYSISLMNADIILLVRVLDGWREMATRREILENIVSRIKEGALLLLIDSGVGTEFLKNIDGFENLCTSDLGTFELKDIPETKFNTESSRYSNAQIAVFRKD